MLSGEYDAVRILRQVLELSNFKKNKYKFCKIPKLGKKSGWCHALPKSSAGPK